MKIFYFIGVFFLLNKSTTGLNSFIPDWQWHYLDWNFPTNADRDNAIQNGQYDPASAIPIDADIYFYPETAEKLTFVTVPRFGEGVPATLNTIVPNSNPSNITDPLLEPYPSWEWHQNLSSCSKNRLVSVFRIEIDTCNRLWVLDSGTITSNQICPPQLIAFDPPTGNVLYRYEIPNTQIPNTKYDLVTPIVDVRNNCKNTFVYMAEGVNFNLFVYDAQTDESWKIRNPLFAANTSYETFEINGQYFSFEDGILGMSLSPYESGSDRTLYFHSLLAITENYVSTSVIRNKSLFVNNSNAASDKFHAYPGERPSQAPAEAMSRDGVLFFGAVTPTSIMCWNSAKNFVSSNLDTVAQNNKTLKFASGIKVKTDPRGLEDVVVITNSVEKYMTGTLDTSEINVRIQKASVTELVRGTKCDPGL